MQYIELPGYQICEEVQAGIKNMVYRGVKQPHKTPVIIKFLKAEYPTLAEITRLRHEYKITENLHLDGIIQTYSLEPYKKGYALVVEDMGGRSLNHLLESQSLSIIESLKIAIQLAKALGELHQHQIIHKDIKPSNIIINSQTQQVKITDFSISTRLSRETYQSSNPNQIEGTLNYMSPEQTGRMNRSLDYRTDFYSLGITFYQMLTGKLPFESNDPLKLIHCHIAVAPVVPHQVDSQIPEAVSAIAMKLIAKNAEDRYQSAEGLQADLETCLHQLLNTGNIQDFTPGSLDKSSHFLIPEKLYGREAEVAKLLDAFDRIAGKQAEHQTAITPEIILVSGYSGIGKTRVINEIHKPIVGASGYFISGKFDQLQRHIPYSAIAQAFLKLTQQILAETSEQLQDWQNKLQSALGENAQVIIDVIPELEQILGPQPPVPELGATETQNRFNRVFEKFIRVFTQENHPLVIFLDDLQWADSASLKFIEKLMSDSESQSLLLVGAYRDNEVSPLHPTIQTLEKIKQAGTIINEIVLQPLDLSHIIELIRDALGGMDSLALVSLGKLLYHKTGGNPFFLTQLLQTLYAEKLLKFDFVKGTWNWSLQQIQSVGITDCNVVELVARNLQTLPELTQKVLKLAACIGNQFNLEVLAIVNETSPEETAAQLWDALQAGLILPGSEAYKIPLFAENSFKTEGETISDESSTIAYKFLHDRVQQSAYSLIPETQKQETHLKIGQLLLQATTPEGIEVIVFDLVNQLNVAVDLINSRSEQYQLAKLNLIASQKAKAAIAYEAALQYVTVGLKLLPSDSWKADYALTFSLHLEAIELEYLNGNFEEAGTLLQFALNQTLLPLDRVKVCELQMHIYIAQLQMLPAIEQGLDLLTNLGTELIELQPEDSLVIPLPSLSELDTIPTLSDPYKLSALRILTTLCAPIFFAKPQMFPQTILTMVQFCIHEGNSGLAAFAYAFYGLFLSGLGEIDAGYHSGQIALKLLEEFDSRQLAAKVYNLFNAHNRPWKEHGKNSLPQFREGVQRGLETGDIEWACYCAGNYCGFSFLTEDSLEFVVEEQQKYIDIAKKSKIETAIYYGSAWRQLGLNLLGEASENTRLTGASFDEGEMLPRLIASKSGTVLFMVYLCKTILFYQFKQYHEAVKAAALTTEQTGSAMGYLQVAVLNFYESLSLLGEYPTLSDSSRPLYLERVETNQTQMKTWAFHARSNFQHKYDLVAAERARVLGENFQAMELYDSAITGAKQAGYVQEEAIANELAAEFYFSCGRNKLAKLYLTDAYYGYIHWGAKAKVKDLEVRYPEFFQQILRREPLETQGIPTLTSNTTTTTASVIDTLTIVKASQALSEEIRLDRLLDKLIQILLENAAATKGLLFLKKAGSLVLVAEGILKQDKVEVMRTLILERRSDIPEAVVNYVERTQKTLVLNNARAEGLFTSDPYIVKAQPKSILCMPLTQKGKESGILYLENKVTIGAFTVQRLDVLKLLCTQASISLENAGFYEQLQDYSYKLEEKNAALQELSDREREKADQLAESLYQLQQTQAQLVQTEKISSLGQLVAGVAHEVNNPVGFIAGNLTHAIQYVTELLDLVNLYEHYLPNPPVEISEKIADIELEYIKEDLPELLNSMIVGTERIKDIMQSLRNFSRVDAVKKPTDINAGLDSTLMILTARLKGKGDHPGMKVIKEYGNLPQVTCFGGQLNQVFMNIIANAIDAIDEMTHHPTKGIDAEAVPHPAPTIRICTEVAQESVFIHIVDNGKGMPEEVRDRIFNAFFTTKPEGKGTGLGMSISQQIVVEKHGGSIRCLSALGQGTEFIIQIPLTPQTQKVDREEIRSIQSSR